ncbi:MAG: aminotransferase class V-fold PLP-dependent enzyme [Lachnospiraceae bacterium]|nr:aminotransferase class V-fold PLP-dependent enzyme [Lachnospiraceae bacterium]
MIYLDNAATTMKKPPEVVKAVCAALEALGNSGRGAHEGSLDASRVIYGTRLALAGLFHVSDPRRIVFSSNSTESLNTAIKGIFKEGDHVISTVLEHNSVLRPLYELKERGVSLSFAGADEKGRLKLEEIEGLITPKTRGIVVTHASNLTGNIVDVGAVAALAKKRGLLTIVDASQSAGAFPIDLPATGIDVLCFTGHKALFGPQGTGGMVVGEGVKIRPLKTGGTGVQTFSKTQPEELPTALEAGTLNGHSLAGLKAGVEFILETGITAIGEREAFLARRFYEAVKEVPGLKFYGDYEAGKRCPIVTLNIGDYDSAEVSDALFEDFGIATRSGGHCAPLMHETFGTVEQGAVRFSFSYFNIPEEADAAAEAVKKIAEQ